MSKRKHVRRESGAQRNAKLSDEKINEIVNVLDGWTGVLTWEALAEKLSSRWGGRPRTRQGLLRHSRVKTAFRIAKARLRKLPVANGGKPTDSVKALERIYFLEAQNERLTAENNTLREQFVRWAYNAHTKGVDERYLNLPLPHIDRQPSRR